MDLKDEQALIAHARRDPAAFAPIYDRYVNRIYGFIRRRTADRQTAEDLTAATFEAALRGVSRFKWRGTGIAAWLYRIAQNKLTGHYRRERVLAPLTRLLQRDHRPRNRADFAAQFETSDWLISALSGLAEADREVIVLRFFEGLSSDEAAEVLGCSKSNLYVRLHRALRRLATKLEASKAGHEVTDG